MTGLFESGGRHYSSLDIEETLRDLGVASGDILFVHSDVGKLGKLIPGNTRNSYLNGFVTALEAAIGPEGTLVMPTFTYSFTKDELFDPAETPSTVGALTDFFWRLEGVVRSEHPIFSVAARGALQDQLIENVDPDSFGSRSIFAKIEELDAKQVFLSVPPSQCCTFFHYLEQRANVPYRYSKKFSGKMVQNGRVEHCECTFFVRNLERKAENDFSRVQSQLEKENILTSQPLGHSNISIAQTAELSRAVRGWLLKDSDYMLRKTTIGRCSP